MSAFSGLKLIAAKRPQTAAPAVVRRAKLAGQLAEQMELVRANAAGTTYAPVRMRSVLDKATGLRNSVEHAKRVRQLRHQLVSLGKRLQAIDPRIWSNSAVLKEMSEICIEIELTLAATDPKAK